MANSWFRLWHDFTIDPKWRAIAHLSDKPLHMVQAIAVFLMSDASCNEMQRGATKCNALTVACATGCNEADVASVLQAMQGIILDGNKFINWEKRQPKREREQIQGSTALSSTERSRLRRERLKDATATDDATPCNAQDTDKKEREESIYIADLPEPEKVTQPLVAKKSTKKSKDENLYTEDFNAFWEVYPSNGRAKGSKHKAAIAFAKAIKISTIQQISQGIQAYAQYISSSNQLNQDASTWLNGRGWADSYAATPIVRPILPAANPGGGRQARIDDFAENALREWANSIPFESFDDGDSSSEYSTLPSQSRPYQAAGEGYRNRHHAELLLDVA